MRERALKYVLYDDVRGTHPFAVAFFMFRAGQHQLALDYLSHPDNSQDVISFAQNVYKVYWQVFNMSIPKEKVAAFCTEYDREFGRIHDIYKEALFNLMIGSNFKTYDDEVFWNALIPSDLES